MKATLTIEVPDDFVRAECEKCPLAIMNPYTGDESCVIAGWNCPLEIQEDKE